MQRSAWQPQRARPCSSDSHAARLYQKCLGYRSPRARETDTTSRLQEESSHAVDMRRAENHDHLSLVLALARALLYCRQAIGEISLSVPEPFQQLSNN